MSKQDQPASAPVETPPRARAPKAESQGPSEPSGGAGTSSSTRSASSGAQRSGPPRSSPASSSDEGASATTSAGAGRAAVVPVAPARELHGVWLQFVGMEPELPVTVEIYERCPATWSLGSMSLRPVGLRLEAQPTQGPIELKRLSVSPKRLCIVTATATPVLRLRMFVDTPRDNTLVRGVVRLDGGATLELQTQWDLTTVLGSGTFCVDVGADEV